MKLMILNLDRDIDENELATLFKTVGNITSSTIIMDSKTGKSKGFGFVEMALEHEGPIAIEKLHGQRLGKNKIRVKAAN